MYCESKCVSQVLSFECQESHIHALINVLRYCYLDDALQGESSLVSPAALHRLFDTKELDYLTHVVLRMYENTLVRVITSMARYIAL